MISPLTLYYRIRDKYRRTVKGKRSNVKMVPLKEMEVIAGIAYEIMERDLRK